MTRLEGLLHRDRSAAQAAADRPAGSHDRPCFVYDDGGRAAVGRRGDAEDCVTRALAIVTGRPYLEVYDLMAEGMASLSTKGKRSPRSASRGVSPRVFKPIFAAAGFTWRATMGIGTGTTVHVRAAELPATGRHILRLSGHLAAWVDGELRDTHDCSRGGTRAVYGLWTLRRVGPEWAG